jgi:hypothetical protein
MSARSTLEELRQLSEITEKCVARVLAAQGQAQSYAHHYRINAEEFRKQAACCRFPEIRERLLRIAASNERLCSIAELAGDATRMPPQIKSETDLRNEELRDRERWLQDRLALSETIYTSTAVIIQETRDAIDSSLNRLRMRSNFESGTVAAPQVAPRLASEAGAGIQPKPNDEESRQGVVRYEPDEDPVAQARRHVRQAEGHVARQEALVERLSDNVKHAALADQAGEVLDTLRRTLSLAREHLALELKTFEGPRSMIGLKRKEIGRAS